MGAGSPRLSVLYPNEGVVRLSVPPYKGVRFCCKRGVCIS
ncbi:hypothetical protein HMPREF1325_0364 [Treponema socranskii subsp. socranskii VPI DR56BR1116 = ATCC 35536]|uniref:Uncharacterized protein n=1 Tax=Treponema socranskii subsp. socranskii VPI DR56BR1116 = ATCC 35536 TaxID=1125725 RepID=U1FHZ3_TRESO|nr:hypothetical protein HMPREF1325_0364 [Treponema socranskii subsp. socranskii VPI DR56BR1116 = ATCC 35536]